MQTISRNRLRFLLISLAGASLLFIAAFRFQKRDHSHEIPNATVNSSRLSQLPAVILWAWERPEQLDFIDTQKVGVAFLAKTIYLRSDQAVSRPRLQPLALPADARIIAVARIESDRHEPPTLSSSQITETANEIAQLGSLPKVVMVQVDFDATSSERAFYRELLTELRSRLPTSISLSITALASWCKGDNWLDNLPVDEAVPMLFRMGVERRQFLSQLAAGERFSSQRCQASAGVSTDEPLTQLPHVERLYVFNPAVWTPDDVNHLLETYNK
jgi:hypothetical protein